MHIRYLFFLAIIAMFQNTLYARAPYQMPKNPFSYDLGVRIIPGQLIDDTMTLCCHGYGHNNQIVDCVAGFSAPLGHLVGFNFPDYDIVPTDDHRYVAYGTVNEIVPLLYLLQYYVCQLHVRELNLYGFSAGCGALVNAIAHLTQPLHDDYLQKIGLTHERKKEILNALARGYIILDSPLKSMQEIIDFRGRNAQLEFVARNYLKNGMNPIDVLTTWSNVNLNIIVHFQDPDDILGNRDDGLFIERLRAANKGQTVAIIGSTGGHNSYHGELWDYFKKLKKNSRILPVRHSF